MQVFVLQLSWPGSNTYSTHRPDVSEWVNLLHLSLSAHSGLANSSPLLLLGIVDVNGPTHPCDDTSRLEKGEESDGISATAISTGFISCPGGAV
jgi:hypothetical protein